MQPNERRRKIIEILNLRRHDTMQNLANEFGVSRLTIYRDLLILEEDYPLIRVSGRTGGIAFPDGYYANKHYLRTEPFFKVFSTTLLYLGNTSLNLDNLIPSTAGMFLPQRATREGAPGRAEATPHRAIPSVPQAAPAGCLATTWGGLQ